MISSTGKLEVAESIGQAVTQSKMYWGIDSY
eukprot:CAMPEP_0114575744 /NCGR_PEP_ID=MMETSP0125-20121206/575_1 /TAXON_ID=485358 ORGANISM="Aristerostoma sp., Strain ATCC 50986" /NCGR_SAMPLE_ID=MMETSP0125 /ASSEMBLY_ACC=CAM_ASM_000245 /LENGTH=30 /DNA_ID= /DNA_START= /DNA_END= /DNA_ORIENTATION=